jgi:hypothetical protein
VEDSFLLRASEDGDTGISSGKRLESVNNFLFIFSLEEKIHQRGMALGISWERRICDSQNRRYVLGTLGTSQSFGIRGTT